MSSGRAAPRVRARRVEARAVLALPRPARAAQPRSLVRVERAGRVGDLDRGLADDRARRHLHAALDGLRRRDRDRRRVAARLRARLRADVVHDDHLRDARLLARDAAADHASRSCSAGSRSGASAIRRRPQPGSGKLVDQAHHLVPALPDADDRLPRRVRDRDALVAARHDARGLPRARPGERAPRHARAPPPRGPERAAARRHADRDQLRLRPLGRDRGGDDLLVARARPADLRRDSTRPTCRCCRGSSSSSAPP